MLGVVVRRPFLERPRVEAAGCECCEPWSEPRAGSSVSPHLPVGRGCLTHRPRSLLRGEGEVPSAQPGCGTFPSF